MGEVRIPIRIINATDEVLVRRGNAPQSSIRSLDANAVVDIGAVRSCIPIDLVQKLGLTIDSKLNARMANGAEEVVQVTEPAIMEILGRRAAEAFLVLGDEILIGQTALESTDLLVDCVGQRVIPNPDHPNSLVIRVR